MMAAKSAIVPVYELMRDEHEPFNPADYLPVIAGYYADTDGNMLSFPLNASTPILYYNKDQFRFAGPQCRRSRRRPGRSSRPRPRSCAPPAMRAASRPTIRPGSTSRTSSPSTACRSRRAPTAWAASTRELVIDNPLMVNHLAALAIWQKSGVFDYSGRTTRGERRFVGARMRHLPRLVGEPRRFPGAGQFRGRLRPAALLAGRGGRAAQLDHRRRQPVGAARPQPMPNTRAWRSSSPILSRPDVQANWHQTTGYLPITRAAYELTRIAGLLRQESRRRHRRSSRSRSTRRPTTPRACGSAPT